MNSPSSVANALRARIMRLEVGTGVPLREIALSEEFGCSRRTVREALLLLKAEGLVAHERNRGASVRSFDEGDIRDLYLVRRWLEVLGARACATARDDALAETSSALDRLAAEARVSQDTAEHAIADMRFHASVIALIGSRRIDGFFDGIAVEMAYAIRLLQHDELESRIDAERVIADHSKICDAVLARDPDAAEAAVLAHITENEERLIRLCAYVR